EDLALEAVPGERDAPHLDRAHRLHRRHLEDGAVVDVVRLGGGVRLLDVAHGAEPYAAPPPRAARAWPWQDPLLVPGRRSTRARIARLALLLGLLAAAAGPAGAASTVDVYFLQGEQAVAVQRPGTDAQAAVEGLLAGPTADERAKGIRTQLPAGVP